MKNTLFAIGEALIDFIPSETGCDFKDVKSFSPKIGGAPANVLGAFAKLGGRTQLITQLGDDPFGDKIVKELAGFNIGLDNVLLTDLANTALAFVSLANDGNRTFSFYRNPSADMLYDAENIREEMFEDCFALHFCSVSLGDFPMKEAHKKAIGLAKTQGAVISFDPNIRFPLWNDTEKLKEAIDEFLTSADIIKISDEEIEFITGTNDIEAGSKMLLENAKIVLCTCGAKGAYALTKNSQVYVPSNKVKAVDTTGAGDAFIGSFLYNLYRNGYERDTLDKIPIEELKQFVKASNDYCTKSVQVQGAIESYPDVI
ncbi:MAG: carbohydrate kinase [Clostridiales bacterium]|nr:carbohydrate kinase [Clostridiales bacterium]